jgi:hypothetical protein
MAHRGWYAVMLGADYYRLLGGLIRRPASTTSNVAASIGGAS